MEIFFNGTWGTICDDNWDMKDAHVVCYELGFSKALRAPTEAHFGAGSGPIWLDEVQCVGTENSLTSCRHNGWNIHNCNHNEDASVICLKNLSMTMILAYPKKLFLELSHAGEYVIALSDQGKLIVLNADDK